MTDPAPVPPKSGSLLLPLLLYAVLTFAAAGVLAKGTGGWGWAPLLQGAAFVLGASWVGWAFRQAWRHPRVLQEAERRWTARAPVEALTALLDRALPAVGETGYRLWLLRGHVAMALWDREAAWSAYREAHLRRLPFWHRVPVRRFLRVGEAVPLQDRLRRGGRLLRLAPAMPHLHLEHARDLFRLGTPAGDRDARRHLKLAAQHGAEDPLLLDMLLREAIAAPGLDRSAAGKAHVPPPLSARAHRLLALLLDRHGDPRISWGRGTVAWRLVLEGDLETTLRVTRSLPFEHRLDPLVWQAEIEALHRLGDAEEAWNLSRDALQYRPDSLQLWQVHLQEALESRRDDEARAAVQRLMQLWARTDAAQHPGLHAEWRYLEADFRFTVEGDAAAALALLELIPSEQIPAAAERLRVELDLALERYAEAYATAQQLRERHPEDPDLPVLMGEALAGMGEWDNLNRFLAHLEAPQRKLPPFLHLSGLVRSHRGDTLGAREELERAAALEPGTLRYLLDAGYASMDLSDWLRAERYWRMALQLDEQNAEALLQLAEVREAQHDREGARQFLRECLTHHPEDPEAQTFLSELESN